LLPPPSSREWFISLFLRLLWLPKRIRYVSLPILEQFPVATFVRTVELGGNPSGIVALEKHHQLIISSIVAPPSSSSSTPLTFTSSSHGASSWADQLITASSATSTAATAPAAIFESFRAVIPTIAAIAGSTCNQHDRCDYASLGSSSLQTWPSPPSPSLSIIASTRTGTDATDVAAQSSAIASSTTLSSSNSNKSGCGSRVCAHMKSLVAVSTNDYPTIFTPPASSTTEHHSPLSSLSLPQPTHIISTNMALSRLLGYSTDELIARSGATGYYSNIITYVNPLHAAQHYQFMSLGVMGLTDEWSTVACVVNKWGHLVPCKIYGTVRAHRHYRTTILTFEPITVT
jgi:hypothetical protein